MGRYTTLVGRRVEARYRADNISHCVRGKLSSDNGTSIFIEDRFLQDGREKTMRVEIPYEFVIRVEEVPLQG